MSVRSRLSGKEYPNMDAFVSDLQAGVNEDIETAVAPLRQQIANLQRQVSSLQSSATTEGGTTDGGTTSGGTTSTTTYNISTRWTGGVGLPTIPLTITVNGTSFTAERESSIDFSQRVPAGARVTVSTPYRGAWVEGQINATTVAFDATSYTFTATRSTTLTVSLQPQ
jgi:hypothetical protein